MRYHWSVFTKPWKHMEAHALAEHVANLGFDGIELPVRPDFQVEPDRAERDLPQFARVMREHGLSITSVASTIAEPVFAGCQAAKIPLIRIMIAGDSTLSWQENLAHAQQELDTALPLCEKYGVSVGVQHHYGFSIFHPMELKVLLDRYDPRWIGGVWDAAHSALAGEPPKKALDILGDHLLLVNLKNAYMRRINGPEAAQALYRPYFTTGPQGASSWHEVADALRLKKYAGSICMCAEYTDIANTDYYIAQDLQYAKSIFEAESSPSC